MRFGLQMYCVMFLYNQNTILLIKKIETIFFLGSTVHLDYLTEYKIFICQQG